MRVRSRFLIAAIVAVMPTSSAVSQRAFCFWPHPLPKCDSHLVLEFNATYAPLSTSGAPNATGTRRRDYRTNYGLSLGGMVNRDEHQATGIVASFAIDRGGLPSALELRRHYWRGEGGTSLGAGLASRNVQKSSGTFNTLGVTASASAENAYVGLNGRVDVTRGGGRMVSGVLVGVHTTTRTSALVPVTALVGALLAGIYLGVVSRF